MRVKYFAYISDQKYYIKKFPLHQNIDTNVDYIYNKCV